MASPAFEAGRPGEAAFEAVRLLERALRDSRAVDLEALCVLAGRKARPLPESTAFAIAVRGSQGRLEEKDVRAGRPCACASAQEQSSRVCPCASAQREPSPQRSLPHRARCRPAGRARRACPGRRRARRACQTWHVRQVWHVRVDVHVLDHAGNLADAVGLAALGALLAFRRPEASVAPGGGAGGGTAAVTLHDPELREPLPLSLHHLPLAVTFALFEARAGRPRPRLRPSPQV